jgi:hypothetical protein
MSRAVHARRPPLWALASPAPGEAAPFAIADGCRGHPHPIASISIRACLRSAEAQQQKHSTLRASGPPLCTVEPRGTERTVLTPRAAGICIPASPRVQRPPNRRPMVPGWRLCATSAQKTYQPHLQLSFLRQPTLSRYESECRPPAPDDERGPDEMRCRAIWSFPCRPALGK